MPDTELVNIKIDGIALQAPKGESVIEAAKRVNIDIPFFCYHPRLSMAEGGANCRMCLVDVAMPRKNPDGTVMMAKMPKPQTACSLPVAEGMEVTTESEQVVKDRKGILEFLLINHPLDCPICDRGGECPLQNNTLHYGPPTTRYVEEKRHFPKAYPLSKYVVLDRERCIHCARCTRFTRDVSGDSQLDFLFRGADMEIGTFAHTEFQSKFSGNVIEICPVGALLSRTYRFKARPWDLLTQKSICNRCSNGCNVKIDYRVNKIQRVNARENDYVNEEWTCDKGKFGMDYLSSDERLTRPLVRQGDTFVPISWDDANRLMLEKIEAAGAQIGGIGGAHAANEDLYAWQKFFREQLGVNNLDHRMGPHFPATSAGLFARFGYHTMGQSIASLEEMKTILVFGSNLVDEQPILFLRVRKAWRFKGASVVEAVPRPAENEQYPNHVGEFASVRLHYRPGTEVALINGLLHVLFEEGLLSAGNGTEGAVGNVDAFKSAIDVSQWTADRAAQECGVEADAIRRAARLLATNKLSILAGCDVTHHPHMDDVLKALGNLAVITGNAGRLNLPVTEVNQQGAMDLGILPDSLPGYAPAPNPGMNTEQMLKAAATGELKLMWLLGGDLVNEYHDPELARRALEGSPFTIVHALTLSDTAKMADLVLPVQSLAEREGTFTNVERRVQRFWRCFEYAPEIKADWTIFTQLSGLRGNVMPFFTARDVLREIAAKVPIYKDCGPRQLGDLGVRWEYPSGEAPEAKVERVAYAPAGAPK